MMEWIVLGGMGLCLLAMFVVTSTALVTTKVNRYTIFFALLWIGSGSGLWTMAKVVFFGGELT